MRKRIGDLRFQRARWGSLRASAPLRFILLFCTFDLGVWAGCRQDMHDQAKYEPLEASSFFADGRSARPVVAGTVARGQLHEDELLYTGKVGGQYASVFPFAIDRSKLERGQERYAIFCAPCHDQLGSGQGMIVQCGSGRRRRFTSSGCAMAPGMIFDVITNGFATMWSYGDRITPEDRWAIAAYVKVLQLSQNARLTGRARG